MAISKSGCSSSITKADLDASYKQGFAECARAITDIILSMDICEVLKKRGYPCGEENCEPARIVLDEILNKLN